MHRKKDSASQIPAEDQALHKRVYEMMELDRMKTTETPEATAAEPALVSAPSEANPIDIFKDLKTAPTIPEISQPEGPAPSKVQPEPETQAEQPVKKIIIPAIVPTPAKTPAKELVIQPIPATEVEFVEPIDIDDAVTDKAIDEIVLNDSDALLVAEDAALQLKTLPAQPKKPSTLGRLFKTNKKK